MSELQNPSLALDYFLGVAHVRIEHLDFESGVRDYDERNVARLRDIFKLEKCQRDDPKHHIPALASSAILGDAWRGSEKPAELTLPRGQKILCLHGKHRIIAAREVLTERNQWWTVRLYDECK